MYLGIYMKTISVTITEKEYEYSKKKRLTPSRLLQNAIEDLMNANKEEWDGEIELSD